MLHCKHVFRHQIRGVLADDRDAQYAILARCGEHFDKPRSRFVHDRAIEILERIKRDFEGCFFLCRLRFVEPHVSDFRIGERCPGNRRIVRLDVPEPIQQCIRGRMPGLVSCSVRKLIRP